MIRSNDILILANFFVKKRINMTGTLVTEKNMHMFLPAFGKETIDDDDLVIGVVDEETDTACGVLWARQDREDELEIISIFVAEGYRNRGAGKELISFLIDISKEISIKNITCSYIDNRDNTYLYQLLDNAGFADMSEELELYAAKVEDLARFSKKYPDEGIRTRSLVGISVDIQRKLVDLDIKGSIEELSFVAFDEKQILGIVLFGRLGKMIELRCLKTFGGDQENVRYCLYIAASKEIRDRLDPETFIILHADTEDMKNTIAYITDGEAIRFEEFYLFNLRL